MLTSALLCLATAVYFEARDQSLRGQLAVAQVVLERVRDPRYPDDICAVVTAGGEERHQCAFSFYCDGKSDRPTDQRAYMLAQWVALAAGSGLLPPMAEGATHYHASHVQPHWVSSMEPAARIEDHAFYREK
jgi:spore germination cell wall hydrolase CwlJ-like protein